MHQHKSEGEINRKLLSHSGFLFFEKTNLTLSSQFVHSPANTHTLEKTHTGAPVLNKAGDESIEI